MIDVLQAVVGGGGLSCVYFAMLAVGVLYSLVILIGGGLAEGAGDMGDVDFGGDVDVGDALQGQVDLTHISPVTIAGFVTAFGAFGILAQNLFNVADPLSLVWATVGGVLVGLVSHLVFYFVFIKPQGSSEVTRRDIVGARGEVITPIPAGGVGEIAVVAQGARMTLSARSVDDKPIRRGAMVIVDDRVGSVALVRLEGRKPDME